VEVEVGADGPVSAPPSGAAAGTSKIHRDRSVGALDNQENCFEVVPRPEIRQEPVAPHLRPTPPQRYFTRKPLAI
jgi:hypothetical protein